IAVDWNAIGVPGHTGISEWQRVWWIEDRYGPDRTVGKGAGAHDLRGHSAVGVYVDLFVRYGCAGDERVANRPGIEPGRRQSLVRHNIRDLEAALRIETDDPGCRIGVGEIAAVRVAAPSAAGALLGKGTD